MTRELLRAVANWKQEAAEEAPQLFYVRPDFRNLVDNKTYIVSGRKGAGKSAMLSFVRRHAESQPNDCVYHALSAAELDFNAVHLMAPTRQEKIGYWREILLLAALAAANKAFAQDGLLSEDAPLLAALNDMMAHMRFSPTLRYKDYVRTVPAGTKLQDRAFMTKMFAIKFGKTLNARKMCFISIDSLDLGFRHDQTQDEQKSYLDTLEALLNAATGLAKEFDEFGNLKLWPVVVIRSDIFDKIENSDKHKWFDAMINLTWNPTQLNQMLAHRIAIESGGKEREVYDFRTEWEKLFKVSRDWRDPVGGEKRVQKEERGVSDAAERVDDNKKYTTPIEYIDLRSKRRPRDYISYCREAAAATLSDPQSDGDRVSNSNFGFAAASYSNLLRQTLLNEGLPHMPDLAVRLGQLAKLKTNARADKFRFSLAEFVTVFGESEEQTKVLLEALYKLDTVGYLRDDKSRNDRFWFHFKERLPNTLDHTRDLIVHQGIWMALG